MEIKPYFKNIREVILENLTEAQKEIYVAMAWFTNHEIYDVILKKSKEIPVNLVVINDDINIRLDGLDFQKFIDNGGTFYFGKSGNPMHNKFCVIDSNVLITGSYNYTYLAESINEENVVVFKGSSDIINNFITEFKNIVSNLDSIKSISEYLELNPYQKNSFSFNNYGKRDIFQHSIEMKNSGFANEAESLMNKLELQSELLTTNDFLIKDLIYRQWKQDYYADKIKLIGNTLILSFRTRASEACVLYGPKSKDRWVLKNCMNEDIITKATKITNIKFNGNEINKSNEIEQNYYFSVKGMTSPTTENFDSLPNGKNEFELTCEIHFNVEDYPLETTDLIEGLGNEKKNSHWHCFDINLVLNRENL